jgi:hypothetical protein
MTKKERERVRNDGVGDVEPPPVFTFGKWQRQPRVDSSGRSTVRGYDTQEMAEDGIVTLMKEIPGSTRQDYVIRQQDDGTFVAEINNPDFREDITYNERFAQARKVADDTKDRGKHYTIPKRVFEERNARGETKLTNPKVHIPTLAFAGMKLGEGLDMRGGMAAMAAKMMERGDLDRESAQEILDQFDKIYPPDPVAPVGNLFGIYAPVSGYHSKKAAQAAMLKIRDVIMNQFDVGKRAAIPGVEVVTNGDGTFSFGITDGRLYKTLAQKNPAQAKAIQQLIRDERRAEKLSGEPIGPGGRDTGVSADPRGTFAGDPDVLGSVARGDTTSPGPVPGETRPIDIRQDAEGAPQSQGPQPKPAVRDFRLEETHKSKTETDIKTNPKNQPSEFEARHRRNDPALGKVDRQPRDNTKTGPNAPQPQTEADNKLLKTVFGRVGKVKVMMTQATNKRKRTRIAVRELVNYVRNTLGLKNSVVVMDDSGLQYMIDNGLVSDPVFKQTLEDPNVHARNIRIGDTSYVYISDRLAGNPKLAVLALGHEMGHHLYSVAWDNLSQDGRNRLREAFDKSPVGKVIAQELLDAQATNDPEGAVSTSQEYEDAFNEWMADQPADPSALRLHERQGSLRVGPDVL